MPKMPKIYKKSLRNLENLNVSSTEKKLIFNDFVLLLGKLVIGDKVGSEPVLNRYMLVDLLLLQSQFSDYITDMLKFLLTHFLQIFRAQVNSEHVEFI